MMGLSIHGLIQKHMRLLPAAWSELQSLLLLAKDFTDDTLDVQQDGFCVLFSHLGDLAHWQIHLCIGVKCAFSCNVNVQVSTMTTSRKK